MNGARSHLGARRQSMGFTLVEALVAMAVLSVGLLALAGLAHTLALHSDAARHRSEATQLAQAKLEELRSFTQALGGSAASFDGLISGTDEPAIASSTRFERSWRISGAPGDFHRRIDVQVDWVDRSGQPDPAGVQLSALVARAEPADSARFAHPDPDAPTQLLSSGL